MDEVTAQCIIAVVASLTGAVVAVLSLWINKKYRQNGGDRRKANKTTDNK